MKFKNFIIESNRHKTPKSEQDWVYLIHHMHPSDKTPNIEELHHCFLYSEKNLKGNKFEQVHVKDGKTIQHCLKVDSIENTPDVVYDHLNNSFKIKVKEIDSKEYAVIDGPVKISNIRWSEQDRS